MTTPNQSTLQCSKCGVPNPIALRRVIDVEQDREGKALLLNGRINSFRCQGCGTVNSVSSPLLYHDGTKDLLIAFVPMDIALRGLKQSEEKMIGDLLNELNRIIPKDKFRAYMFNPKRALTMQGMIEQIMEADGITPEMIAEQKARVELVQRFVEAQSEDSVIALVKELDSKIDATFFQTLSLMAQRLVEQGQQQIAMHLMAIQQVVVEHSSYGAQLVAKQAAQAEVVQEVAARLDTLGENAQRGDFLNLALEFAGDDDKLQALVGLVRPAFDYQFFTDFTTRISAAPAEERSQLESVRDKLNAYAQQIDQQTQAMVQEKAQFLRMLISSPEYEAIMLENADVLDDNFMTILTMNIQEAERRQDVTTSAKLKAIYNSAVKLLQEQMSPELRFLNALLSSESEAELQSLIADNIASFDAELLEVADAVEQILGQQGQNALIQKLGYIRNVLTQALS